MFEVSAHQMPQVKRSKVRNIGDPPIKLFPMAFFDGAVTDSTGDAGVCIWIHELDYFSIKLGCGHNTNTRAELLALWALLYIAKDIGLPYLYVFGDSSVIINWAKEKSTLAIVNLEAWCDNTKKLISLFIYVDFNHVYRNIIRGQIHYPRKGFVWFRAILPLLKYVKVSYLGKLNFSFFESIALICLRLTGH